MFLERLLEILFYQQKMSRPYSIPLQNHDDLSKKSYFEINTKIEDNTPNFRTICIYLFAL